jgi:hypothetical protein
MIAPGLVVLLAALTAADGGCKRLPGPTVPSGFGVNIHFTRFGPGEADRFREAGHGLARMDFSWGGVEGERGRYDFSAYDRLTAELAAIGVRPLYILDYGNRLYDDGQAPHTEAARAAYARFAAAAARHFHGKGVIWELWNEPDSDQFWKPRAKADDYAAMAVAAARAIREADPDAVIVAPGSSRFPWPFLEAVFAAGLLEHLDAVSVHPYRPTMPETAVADYARLRGLIARYAPPAKRMLPILSSEWGYSTREGGGISEARQAQYLARQWLVNLASGVNVSIFYDWKDDGPDPRENEHRFGTVKQDLTPKPSFEAAKALIQSLRGTTFRHRLAGDSERHWRLLFQKGDTDEIALVEWIADPAASEAEQTPKVTPVAPDSPGFTGLRRLAAVHVPAGPLVELTGAPAEVPVTVVPVGGVASEVELLVEGGHRAAADIASISVPASSLATTTLTLSPGPQGMASRPLPTRVTWDGKRLPELHPGTVVRSDAVVITVAPRGDGLVVQVGNPTRKPFQSRVEVLAASANGDVRSAAVLKVPAGAERAEVALPRPAGGLLVQLVEGDDLFGVPLVTARYEPMPGFPAGFQLVPFADNHAGAPKALEPQPSGLVVSYQFDPGWRYAMVTPQGQTTIPEGAKALVVWIEADGSGDSLRSRIRDRTGQTFQADLGQLDWNGWRPVTIPLDGRGDGTHWGGAADGVPHGPLAWEALILIDSARQKEAHQGTLRVASPFYVFDAEVKEGFR